MFRRRLKWWARWLRRDTDDPEGISFRFLKGAGLVSVDTDYGSFHFWVYHRHWVWGHKIDDIGVVEYLGLGPLILAVRMS